MKKIFTLCLALVAGAAAAFASTVDDLKECRHSYVLVADDYTNDGTLARVKGSLFGDGYFLDVTGGSIATNKGKSNPAEMIEEKDEEGNVISSSYRYDEAFAKKYGEYGEHFNSLRLKNAQDVIAMKVTAQSKLIFLLQGNNKTGKDARIPKIAKDAALTEALNAAPTADFEGKTEAGFKYEWTAPDDMTIYIGSYNGDMFIGYIIVEANEAPGTPSVKVGAQTFENGLWYREVTCKPAVANIFDTEFPTVCTYTTDGTAPTAESPIYTEPIKCYNDQVVTFQAFIDYGDGKPGDICEGADNNGNVSFSFDAPSIAVDGANVTIASAYEGAKNFVSYLDQADVETSSITLTESATVTAYSQIVNGSYATFTTKPTSKDVYVLTPIKEKKVITVSGNAVVDEEATTTSTTGTVYKIENGAITAEKADFFVKNLEFAALSNDAAVAKYQVPAGQEAYIKMNATNITFLVAEGDSVDVKVTCSLNACKALNEENDESVTTDRKCYVNVSGTTYGTDDITVEGGNIITFGLTAGTYTFQKYSGTGNILISSIEITPAKEEAPVVGPVIPEDTSNLAVHLEAKGQWATYGLSAECPFTFDKYVDYKIRVANVVGSFNILIESVETEKVHPSWAPETEIDQSLGIFYDNPVAEGTIQGSIIRNKNLQERMAENNLSAGIRNISIQATDDPSKIVDKIDILEVILITADGKEVVQKLGVDGWGGGAYTATPLEYAPASSIEAVEVEAAAEAPAYNLMGQKTAATRGLMIRGGKIILVR